MARHVSARGRRDGERGTTLIELLVSMGIFSLCMTVVFGAVICKKALRIPVADPGPPVSWS